MEILSQENFRSFSTIRCPVYHSSPINTYLGAKVKLEDAKRTISNAIIQIKPLREQKLIRKLQQLISDMESGKIIYDGGQISKQLEKQE